MTMDFFLEILRKKLELGSHRASFATEHEISANACAACFDETCGSAVKCEPNMPYKPQTFNSKEKKNPRQGHVTQTFKGYGNVRKKIGQDMDLGGGEYFFTKSLKETRNYHYILIENMETDLPSSVIVDFIYQQTSVSSDAYVTPSLLSESYTRGTIFLDGQEKLEKLSRFLHNPAHLIMSSRGRHTSLHDLTHDIMTTENRDTLTLLKKLIDQLIMATRISSGLIVNTIDCLEQTTLAEFRHDFQIHVYPIGPLHKHLTETCNSSSLLMEDHSCITWLDRQAPRTIIYVSFGSIAAMDRSELIETAWGLAHSGQPFMWVVQTGLVHGSKWVEFPEGFEDMLGDRGLIVKWAPQQEVLAHPSVGGVWTHCGWNSTLESICEGVPMLCWPCFGDQSMNARLVSHVWRVGIRLEHGLDRDKIEWAIRKLMVGQEGEGMKERIEDLKENVDRCLRKGGSSNQSLNNLIDFILAI
ncbi:UDP-glucose iridoid glucosyltransferase-like [Magnolia sinica]|uniref:UDP-glucose iridoid glucosyltransferase-like n=1 Tax=Magnolia sinica TaxID=86752 RepID=UPI002659E89C|nr:UDP-glucose iridoid glucosyltransferase-like [Magnolia sinica]